MHVPGTISGPHNAHVMKGEGTQGGIFVQKPRTLLLSEHVTVSTTYAKAFQHRRGVCNDSPCLLSRFVV